MRSMTIGRFPGAYAATSHAAASPSPPSTRAIPRNGSPARRHPGRRIQQTLQDKADMFRRTTEIKGRRSPSDLTVSGSSCRRRRLSPPPSANSGHTRTSVVSGQARAPYCLMGTCFECLMKSRHREPASLHAIVAEGERSTDSKGDAGMSETVDLAYRTRRPASPRRPSPPTGLSVVLLDEQPAPGGRFIGTSRISIRRHSKRTSVRITRKVAPSRKPSGPQRGLPSGATVWRVDADGSIAWTDGTTANSGWPIIAATGALERPVPIPG